MNSSSREGETDTMCSSEVRTANPLLRTPACRRSSQPVRTLRGGAFAPARVADQTALATPSTRERQHGTCCSLTMVGLSSFVMVQCSLVAARHRKSAGHDDNYKKDNWAAPRKCANRCTCIRTRPGDLIATSRLVLGEGSRVNLH